MSKAKFSFEAGRCLALDLGVFLGYAYYSQNGKLVFGSQELKPSLFKKHTDNVGLFDTVPNKKYGCFFLFMEGVLKNNPTINTIILENMAGDTYRSMAYGTFKGVLIAIFASRKHKLFLPNYKPKVIKKAFTGNGKADKKRIALVVKAEGLTPQDEHANDAVAILYTHSAKIKEKALLDS